MIKQSHIIQSVIALLFGVILIGCGYMYVVDEFKLSEVYELLRSDNKENTKRDNLHEYFASIEYKVVQRGDIARLFLDVSLNIGGNELRNLRLYGGGVVRYSPMVARAWCVLSFSSLQTHEFSKAAVEQLRACYRLGRYEDEVVGGRLALVFSVWDQLPEDLRLSAISEVAGRLREQGTRLTTIRHLALAVATVAPQQQVLAETLVESQGEDSKKCFERFLVQFRKTKAGF
jgi:hypothetical protein